MIKVGFSSQVPQLHLFAMLLWSFPSILWSQRPHSQSRPAPGVEVAFRSVYFGSWGSGEKVDLETRVCWVDWETHSLVCSPVYTVSGVSQLPHPSPPESPQGDGQPGLMTVKRVGGTGNKEGKGAATLEGPP